jgi:hypothetical protein
MHAIPPGDMIGKHFLVSQYRKNYFGGYLVTFADLPDYLSEKETMKRHRQCRIYLAGHA